MNLPRFLRLSALWPCLALLPVSAAAPAEAPGTVYELRTYVAAPGKGEAVLARFREHTTRLFERHGMVNVGYWVAADAKDGGAEKLIYLLRHRSREAAKASWQGFLADPDWRAVAKAIADVTSWTAPAIPGLVTPRRSPELPHSADPHSVHPGSDHRPSRRGRRRRPTSRTRQSLVRGVGRSARRRKDHARSLALDRTAMDRRWSHRDVGAASIGGSCRGPSFGVAHR